MTKCCWNVLELFLIFFWKWPPCQNIMHSGNSMELNFEGLEMQKWNEPTYGADRIHKKNQVVFLVIVFTLRAIVTEVSKIVYALYILLIAAKNQSQFENNIYMHLIGLIWFFVKMLWVTGFLVTISNISILENNGVFFCLLSSFLCVYPEYLTNGNSKTYWPYPFLKKKKQKKTTQ